MIFLGTTPTVQRTMMFDRLHLDDVNRAKAVVQHASGKSVNAARVAGVLGASAIATGFLGGDSGRFLRQCLDAQGIRHDFVEIASPTRLCITLLDRAAHTATELVEEHGPATAEETSALLQNVQTLLAGKKWLIMSGSLAPGVPDGFYADCCAMAHQAWANAIVDGRGEALLQALPQRPMVIKPNIAELSATVKFPIDGDTTLKRAIAAAVDLGATWIVVTMGKAGAVASDGKEFWRITSPAITPVNAIGSGDAFAAGLTVALSRGADVPQACRLATACGVANALTNLSGQVELEDVKRIELQVQIVRM